MSDEKPDYVIKGESFAEAALRKVFEFSASFAPENDFESTSRSTAQSHADVIPKKPPGYNDVGSSKIVELSSRPAGTPFKAEDYSNDGKRHLLLACSGSVASIKLPNMVKQLSTHSKFLSIRIVLTSSAVQFLQGQADEQPSWKSLSLIPGVDGIHLDADEWATPWTRGAPILHIELRRWADLLVIAPLSANTLAKMVNGLCDNLLTSCVRAFDTQATMGFTAEDTAAESETQMQGTPDRKLIMVAPAMNTAMWQHPVTGMQLKVLKDDWHWVEVLLPTEKALACGDVGVGAMKEWSLIVHDIEDALKLQPS